MASKRKQMKLPVQKDVTTANKAVPVPTEDTEWRKRERQHQIEDGLRTLSRAEEIRGDKGLMKEIKAHARKQAKVCE